jgi:hypothetical protein
MSAASVKQYVSKKLNAEIQVFVESQRDVDGDFNNLQRELKVAFMLSESSALPEVMLENGLLIKRGVRSNPVTVLVVYTKGPPSWTTAKVELSKVVEE